MFRDIAHARLDDKGRLKVPAQFLHAMALKNGWFLSVDGDGRSLQVKTNGESNEKVEIDRTGRISIRPELSAKFKGNQCAWPGRGIV